MKDNCEIKVATIQLSLFIQDHLPHFISRKSSRTVVPRLSRIKFRTHFKFNARWHLFSLKLMPALIILPASLMSFIFNCLHFIWCLIWYYLDILNTFEYPRIHHQLILLFLTSLFVIFQFSCFRVLVIPVSQFRLPTLKIYSGADCCCVCVCVPFSTVMPAWPAPAHFQRLSRWHGPCW